MINESEMYPSTLKFRKEQIDEIIVIERNEKTQFCKAIKDLSKKYILIDIQYAVTDNLFLVYSALILARRKS